MDDEQQRVPCPWCAEQILPDAKVCRYCGRPLDMVPPAERAPLDVLPVKYDGPDRSWPTVLGVLVACAVMVGIIFLVFRGIVGSQDAAGASGSTQQVALAQTAAWVSDDAMPALLAASDKFTRATEAQSAGNELRMVSSLRQAGRLLAAVPDSPDEGELSSLLHLAGRNYIEAANAGASGDYDDMNERTLEATQAMDDFNQSLAATGITEQ